MQPAPSSPSRTVRSRTVLRAWAAAALAALLAVAVAPGGAAAAPAAPGGAAACTATGYETVTTDQWAYQPGDTVHVDGRGYDKGCAIAVEVTRPDGVIESFATQTGPDGAFAIDYLLPTEDASGEYTVTVRGSGGAVLATVMFLDAPSARFDVTPAHVPASSAQRFTALVRNVATVTGDTARCVRVVLPSTYTLDATNTSFTVANPGTGTGQTGVWTMGTGSVSGRPYVEARTETSTQRGIFGGTPATANWIRFEIAATTPATAATATWDARMATAFNSTNCQDVTALLGVSVGQTLPRRYSADFRDASGNALTSPLSVTANATETFRVRITRTAGTDDLSYAAVALPTCLTNITGIAVTNSTGGSPPNFAAELSDNVLRLISNASGGVKMSANGQWTQVAFTATVSCPTGTHVLRSASWKNQQPETAQGDIFQLADGTGHPSILVTPAQVQPTITTQATAEATVGEGITDTATLAGGNAPTGTITFNLYGPDDATCTGAPVFTDTVPVAGNGDYTSDPFSPTTVGTYRWIASYSGDANNLTAAGACNDAGETTVVVAAEPTITTQATASVTLGSSITDTATLAGGFNPTGTITFNLYGPDDTECTGTPVFTDTVPVAGNDGYTSDPFTPTAVGTYRWIASYSGDANNAPATGACGDANENSVVVPAPEPDLSITKTADTSPVTAANPIGYTITVTNNGTGAATNVVVTDTLPTNAGLNWSIDPANPDCSITAGVLTCTFATIAADGGTATVHITSPTTFATAGTVTNTAGYASTNGGSGGTGPVTITVEPAPLTCQAPFTPTTVITGRTNSIVVSGNTVISGATINGSVSVAAGANIFIINTTISGSLSSTAGAGSVYMFSSSTGQAVTVSKTTGPVVIGGDGVSAGPTGGCTGNNLKGVTVSSNTGGVTVAHNIIGGALQVLNNVSSGPTLIAANRITSSLNCSGNSPAPTNGGNPNTVGGARGGQCAAAGF